MPGRAGSSYGGFCLLTARLLKNYKSIANCSVQLGPLNFLVGPNGAGKSNFLDALRFVTESLNTSLDHALRERGGIAEVRRRSSGHPSHLGIRLEFTLPSGANGYYAFRIGSRFKGGFEVQQEECYINGPTALDSPFYKVENGGVVKSHAKVVPSASSDRLFLVAASGLPEFRSLYDALIHMGFYNFNPDLIRGLQPPDAGDILRRDGGNLAYVLSVMEEDSPEARDRVVEFLAKVLPGMEDVSVKRIEDWKTLEFKQSAQSDTVPQRFSPMNMSDGTLRALGVLTALFQSANGDGNRVPLLGIEEP